MICNTYTNKYYIITYMMSVLLQTTSEIDFSLSQYFESL